MFALLWLLNFVISIFNAWMCGKTWNETRYVGGMPHFMNWMGAIMSASGFTWCYLVVVVLFGGTYPIEADDGTMSTLLTVDQVQAVADLGYILVVFPILGSGIAITIHAWGVAYRRRTLLNGGIAAWDTFAMVYNVRSALQNVPVAGTRLSDFFSGKGDDKGKLVVVLLVVGCALAGVLSTYLIIRYVSNATGQVRAFQYRMKTEQGSTSPQYSGYSSRRYR
jgi:hypothetical protein